ncbi:hypothetical protein A3B57_01485 [Microgenomates group bacterium RIFCSPLOWO2_01_FULL_47_10]|nr:MAG: hypothetical protein A3B57_01485 [Microgenomates group bacterium RIFCSPLOWO2_01_FULL_47_10]
MENKIKRFSYNQLLVLSAFLKKAGAVTTIAYLQKTTHLAGKSLGGVISSLSRTRFRNASLIEPVGADNSGSGLRWLLNSRLLDVTRAKNEVTRLLKLYKASV